MFPHSLSSLDKVLKSPMITILASVFSKISGLTISLMIIWASASRSIELWACRCVIRTCRSILLWKFKRFQDTHRDKKFLVEFCNQILIYLLCKINVEDSTLKFRRSILCNHFKWKSGSNTLNNKINIFYYRKEWNYVIYQYDKVVNLSWCMNTRTQHLQLWRQVKVYFSVDPFHYSKSVII